MKTVVFLLMIAALSSPSLAQTLPPGNDLMVGYYGRPGVKTMGILGEHSIEALIPKLKAKAKEYAEASGKQKVTPAFHVIYGMATMDPGRDKDHLTPLSDETVMAYIKAAKQEGFAVILDTQLGERSPGVAVQPLLKYLAHENVHLAIDPEFSVDDLNVAPGKKIGHITGSQMNEVQAAMTEYLEKNGIKENKLLIVHNFTEKMVRDKPSVKKYDQINLVMNLDGHGGPAIKIKIYNGMYTDEITPIAAGGFKLFYTHDKPLMTPKQALGLEPVGNHQLRVSPQYINYQ